jgi:hypothetical protein
VNTRPQLPHLTDELVAFNDLAIFNNNLNLAVRRARACVTGISVVFDAWPRNWPLLCADDVLRELGDRAPTIDPLASEVLFAIEFLLSQNTGPGTVEWLGNLHTLLLREIAQAAPGLRLSELLERVDPYDLPVPGEDWR